MFPGLFAALFREAPQQFLVDVTHFQVGKLLRAECGFLVVVEDRRQPVVAGHRSDGGVVVEMLDDLLHVLREAVQILAEVVFDQGRIFRIHRLQAQFGSVGERGLGQFQLLEHGRELGAGQIGTARGDFGLHPCAPLDEHAFEAPNDDHRQDDVLVFVSLELAAQALRGFPDFSGQVVESGLVERKRHAVRCAKDMAIILAVILSLIFPPAETAAKDAQ